MTKQIRRFKKPEEPYSQFYQDMKHSFSLFKNTFTDTRDFFLSRLKKISFGVKVRYEREYIPLSAYIVRKFEPLTNRFVRFSMFVNKVIAISVLKSKRLITRLKSFLREKLKRERKAKFKKLSKYVKSKFKKLSDKIGVKVVFEYGD